MPMRTLHPSFLIRNPKRAFFLLTAAADHSTHSEKMESGMIANAARRPPTLLKPQSVHSLTDSATAQEESRLTD